MRSPPMRYPPTLTRRINCFGFSQRDTRHLRLLSKQLQCGFYSKRKKQPVSRQRTGLPATILALGLFTWWLYPTEEFAQLSTAKVGDRSSHAARGTTTFGGPDRLITEKQESDNSAWAYFARQFEFLSTMTDLHWVALSDKVVDAILPDWSKLVPGYIRKLQRELSASPGSLADEIWHEAHDPLVNPEIQYSACVRVSSELCEDEKKFLVKRRVATRTALATYLGLDEKEVHPDDVPTIAMCGSGGGLRALIAGTGSMLATEEDGLFDCVTYTAGVSGSCWLQLLYLSTFSRGNIGSLLQHLKSRASIHIAYPPVAFDALSSLPTNKYLLSGLVEKLKGDTEANFGLVDIYGLLLGARYLVPKGELGVDARDFKLSNQRAYLRNGQWPLPIYTAVRHEIPANESTEPQEDLRAADTRERLKKEPYFQWFEMTPYEFFCEEFGAGIPTWALGRRFKDGLDVPPEHGFHLPEIRTPLLMGIFGSAFCATLSHYYREIRPLLRTMTGFQTVDEMVSGRDDDLSKVHPIDPATIPNFAYAMYGKLPKTTPSSILQQEYIQLMDAGMSNNLPIYPLLRPGRDVDILVAFDASADIKTDNWLSVADGYARQRGIKGWPVGVGWPKRDESSSQVTQELASAQARTTGEAEEKVREAQFAQRDLRQKAAEDGKDVKPPKPDIYDKFQPGNENAGDLGYCTVWVGTTEERSSDSPPISKPVTDSTSWQLMEPHAGLAVVYLPFIANKNVLGISPGTTEFLSTWNFVYTPNQIDSVVELARANYNEGKEQIRATVRAVYERKKHLREQVEAQRRLDSYTAIVKRGEVAFLNDGDQFS